MENNYREIIYCNKKNKILQYQSESNTQFNDRIMYIKSLEDPNIKFTEAVRLSKIWMCITMKKCKYNKETYIMVMGK
jgi:hypothetical protein